MTRLTRAIPAGLVDGGLASLGTFTIGIYAIRALDGPSLGAYALFFAAFGVCQVFATQIVFQPAEVAALNYSSLARLSILSQTLRLGVGPALAASLGIPATILVLGEAVPKTIIYPLMITVMLSAILSPVQDHVRRVLHLSGVSWLAAAVSGLQLGGAVGFLSLFVGLGVPSAWIPFGALAAANALSLTVGVAFAWRWRELPRVVRPLHFAELFESGRWLLAVGLAPTVGGFVAGSLVTRLASPQALGFAAAAATLAQPIFVAASSFHAVLGPRSMEAAARGTSSRARGAARLFTGLLLLVCAPYFALVAWEWTWSPMPGLLPNAYVVQGLVALAAIAAVIEGLAYPYEARLLGSNRSAALARIEASAFVVRTLVASTAVWTRAFAVPISLVAAGVVRLIECRRAEAGKRVRAGRGGAGLLSKLDPDVEGAPAATHSRGGNRGAGPLADRTPQTGAGEA